MVYIKNADFPSVEAVNLSDWTKLNFDAKKWLKKNKDKGKK